MEPDLIYFVPPFGSEAYSNVLLDVSSVMLKILRYGLEIIKHANCPHKKKGYPIKLG